ncbi:Monooxygenase, FAD-binding protein [Niveomyces insectorum RCEF 264]|uniref:Monooxygenase, FAD-binding protein n=1 Tax=Niveomyces insectorum RCEF 264 TaxID=1081102 RepID=A0A162MNM9_9HYPO|nr:Monooxygenase, FAD-binding protein [Niveomyces insectorum RCEF 264]
MPLDILIVGCSIAGPALASFVQLAPFTDGNRPHITVIERTPSVRPQGQSVDISGVGVTLLDKIGITAAVKASTTGEAGVQWVTADNRVRCEFRRASDTDTQRHNSTSDIEILRGRLAQILWRRSQSITDEAAVEYVIGDYLDDIQQKEADPPASGQQQKVTVHVAKSGGRRTFDVVVGADGLRSSTRRLVWGPAQEARVVRPLGMYAACLSMPRDAGQGDKDYRRCFHTHSRRMLSIRPDQQHGRSTALLTLVNDTDTRFAEAARERSSVAFQKALVQEHFNSAGWQAPRLVRAMQATDDFYYKVARVKMPPPRGWSQSRVLLLGDAAHCASHISGMGTTLALLGAYPSAGALSVHPEDVGAALAAYEDATTWGVWLVDTTIRFLVWTRVFALLMRFKGADTEPDALPDYGLAHPPEYKE